jgi:polar amino acid transport system substrate-binding protein
MIRTLLQTAIIAGTAILVAATPVMAKDLVVGANIGNLPWEFQTETGKTVGFEIDLANEIGKRLGETVDIVNIPFNGLFSAVESGRIDMAASSITITPARLMSVSFAQPYYDSDQSLSSRTDSGIKSLADLKGKTVGVDTGSTGDIWATKHQDEYGIADIRRYEGLSPAMLDLAVGRIDGYISDIPSVQYYVKDKPNLHVVARIPTGEQYSFMFAKNAPLATKVNDIITTLKGDGFFINLYKKWFGVAPDAGTSTVEVEPMPKLNG